MSACALRGNTKSPSRACGPIRTGFGGSGNSDIVAPRSGLQCGVHVLLMRATRAPELAEPQTSCKCERRWCRTSKNLKLRRGREPGRQGGIVRWQSSPQFNNAACTGNDMTSQIAKCEMRNASVSVAAKMLENWVLLAWHSPSYCKHLPLPMHKKFVRRL